jgi:hypothetical protein
MKTKNSGKASVLTIGFIFSLKLKKRNLFLFIKKNLGTALLASTAFPLIICGRLAIATSAYKINFFKHIFYSENFFFN